MVTNAELQQRRAAAVADGWASVYPFYADRARNAEIWDVDWVKSSVKVSHELKELIIVIVH